MGSQLVASVEYVATHSHAGEARTSSTSSKNVLIIVCAYNEARSLPHLLSTLQGMDTLVVDDGSLDDTMKVARRFGAMVLEHDRRLGKTASLADGLSFAIQNSYDIVIEIDADAIPGRGSLAKITRVLDSPKVGGVSAMQVPLGVPNVAYHIDELIWAILSHGKSFQLQATGSCHFGAVLVAFKPELVGSLHGAINDDEQVGRSIRRRGFKTTFDRSAIAYFDASICIGHIIQRRKRMYVGHFK
ncbi:MAG: glycosyltransferase [Thaumarchaeota archaeon]|nr:glycosyltransferase [Nitrososphaerota archaeon]